MIGSCSFGCCIESRCRSSAGWCRWAGTRTPRPWNCWCCGTRSSPSGQVMGRHRPGAGSPRPWTGQPSPRARAAHRALADIPSRGSLQPDATRGHESSGAYGAGRAGATRGNGVPAGEQVAVPPEDRVGPHQQPQTCACRKDVRTGRGLGRPHRANLGRLGTLLPSLSIPAR
jgi:hypothetical protein